MYVLKKQVFWAVIISNLFLLIGYQNCADQNFSKEAASVQPAITPEVVQDVCRVNQAQITFTGTLGVANVITFRLNVDPIPNTIVWNFGDGSQDVVVNNPVSPISISHTYSSAGAFTVRANLLISGCSDSYSTSTNISISGDEFAWVVTGVGPCVLNTANCPSNGVISGTQTQTSVCRNVRTGATVADSNCTSTRPPTTLACSESNLGNFFERIETVGQCSFDRNLLSGNPPANCQAGRQDLTYSCRARQAVGSLASGASVNNCFCSGLGNMQATTRSCDPQGFQDKIFRVALYGACSGACGTTQGTRTTIQSACAHFDNDQGPNSAFHSNAYTIVNSCFCNRFLIQNQPVDPCANIGDNFSALNGGRSDVANPGNFFCRARNALNNFSNSISCTKPQDQGCQFTYEYVFDGYSQCTASGNAAVITPPGCGITGRQLPINLRCLERRSDGTTRTLAASECTESGRTPINSIPQPISCDGFCASCTNPAGGSAIAHGSSYTGFQSRFVFCGFSCEQRSYFCNNGEFRADNMNGVATTPVAGCFPMASFQSRPGEADGSISAPWRVNSCECLQAIENNPGAARKNHSYALTSNIDCGQSTGPGPIAANPNLGFIPIRAFTGNFDGRGFSVNNLRSAHITGASVFHSMPAGGAFTGTLQNITFNNLNLEANGTQTFMGGAALIDNSGEHDWLMTTTTIPTIRTRPTIRNVTLNSPTIRGAMAVGGIFSGSFSGEMSAVSINNANLSDANPSDGIGVTIGGLVGNQLYRANGTNPVIRNSSFSGTITTNSTATAGQAAGIVPWAAGATIDRVTVNATINISSTQFVQMAGISVHAIDSNIMNSNITVNMRGIATPSSSTTTTGFQVGGAVANLQAGMQTSISNWVSGARLENVSVNAGINLINNGTQGATQIGGIVGFCGNNYDGSITRASLVSSNGSGNITTIRLRNTAVPDANGISPSTQVGIVPAAFVDTTKCDVSNDVRGTASVNINP